MLIVRQIEKKFYKLFHPPLGEVLMLHRVIPRRSLLPANRNLEITPSFLEKVILRYQQEGRPMLSIDEVCEIIAGKKTTAKPFVCFTLDDGYTDTFEYAYPLFKKYNCPFVIYLTTDFPNRKALLWWYWLEDILIHTDHLQLGNDDMLAIGTLAAKNQAYDRIRERIFNCPDDQLAKLLQTLFPQYTETLINYANQLALNWEQIKEMSQDKLCTIASHTQSHPVLSRISPKRLTEELLLSKELIENCIQHKIKHFAYPYGIYKQDIIEAVKQAGYSSAVRVNGGNVRKEKQSMFEIKRILLAE